jgi:LTXXQ motif family protein
MQILKISALALACVAGGLAVSQANAEPRGPQSMIDRMCSPDSKGDRMAAFMEKRSARLATMLQLNDAQKASLKDLEDTRAKSRADFKASICAKKPDLSTFPNRLAFREQMMQNRLDALKAETPKLIAFYNSLDDKQKAAFEEMRGAMMRGHGGMMGGRGMKERGPGGPGGADDGPSDE